MSDSHDKSDDLIAELAKLMASGAAGGDGAPKPTVIKLPPLDEATIKAAPVRIPGMDGPVAGAPRPDRPAASTGPAVRIPGMDRPAGVADGLPTAPAPRPGSQFDFAKPAPTAANAVTPPAPEEPREAPKPVSHAAPSGLRIEPIRFGPTPMPGAAPMPGVSPVSSKPVETKPAQSVADRDDADEDDSSESEKDDPIADLIARELEGGGVDEDPPDADEPPPTPAPTYPRPATQPTVVQIKPVTVAPRQPEADRFTVSPSFGGERRMPPPSHAPNVAAQSMRAGNDDADPMDEIENLIGEAVRVELHPQEKPPVPATQAPVVPPLNTGFSPRRSSLREREPQVESAEDAIMAAAAASGAELSQVDAPGAEDRPYKRMRVKPPRTSRVPGGARQYVGIAVAGTLLLASGFGLYWVLGMNRGDPGEAPVLTADASPTKVEPATPVVTTPEPTSGSVVFDEIDGVADAGGEGEALVSRDETAGESISEVARAVTPAPEDEGTEASVAETGLANRKVRTVTVRPDGTIVASDDTVAGTSELPVERPNVPEIAGADVEPSELLTAAVAETRTPADAPAAGAAASDQISALVAETPTTGPSALETPDPIDVAALTPAEEEAPAVFDGSLVAPVPMPRPFNREAMIGASASASRSLVAPLATPAPSTSGANTPASTPLTALTEQPAAAPVRSGGGAYVQLSSQRSEGDASSSLRSVQSRLGSLLTSPLEIRRVDLGAKGIWYRVVMPSGSFQDATQSCARIKANGGDCVAING